MTDCGGLRRVRADARQFLVESKGCDGPRELARKPDATQLRHDEFAIEQVGRPQVKVERHALRRDLRRSRCEPIEGTHVRRLSPEPTGMVIYECGRGLAAGTLKPPVRPGTI